MNKPFDTILSGMRDVEAYLAGDREGFNVTPGDIHNDQELREYTAMLFALTAKDEPTPAEVAAIDRLSSLVTAYEARHRTSRPEPVLSRIEHGTDY